MSQWAECSRSGSVSDLRRMSTSRRSRATSAKSARISCLIGWARMENEQAAMGGRKSVIVRSRESPGAAVSHRRLDAWKAPRLGCALKRLFAPRVLGSAATRWLFRKGRCAASDAGCFQRRNARDEWLDFIGGQISGNALPVLEDSNLARQRGGHWSPKKRKPACSRRRNGDSTTP